MQEDSKQKRFLRAREMPNWFRGGVTAVLLAIFALLQWEQAELSILLWRDTLKIPPLMILSNAALLFLFVATLAVLTGHWYIAGLVQTVIGTIYTLVNSYTYLWHGAPLTLWEVSNAGTALNVLSGGKYEFYLTGTAAEQLALGGLCLIVVFGLFLLRGNSAGKTRRLAALALAGCGIFVYLTLFSPWKIKPRHARLWSWTQSCQAYGYPASLLESTQDYFEDIIEEPEGYSVENATRGQEQLATQAKELSTGSTPDIVFILNESFYDLSLVTELAPDTDLLAPFYEIQNAVHGYAVVPQSCGGTNKSEYELLTGNSMNLIKNQTPFQVLALENANSVVNLLEAQGYSSLAAHIAECDNYNRVYGYGCLGFDEIYFEPDFQNPIKYFGRGRLDSTAYENLIRWYEAMPDSPRLCYLLTCQNHGGYDLMDDEGETVHITRDMGDMTHQINEYLTCEQMSVTALQELMDYYTTVDRPVLVCMVGDHAPSFTSQIADASLSDAELDEKIRSTPFIIWANYPMETQDWGMIDLTTLSARCLKLAGVEMSPYFTMLTQMPQEMEFLPYDLPAAEESADGAASWLAQYYWMEYNNMSEEEQRVESLFLPIK